MKHRRPENPLQHRETFATMDVSTNAHPDAYTMIDLDVASIVVKYRWSATLRRKCLYVRGIVEGRQVLLHRFIMQAPENMDVDHIDGNPLNNLRSNLRLCTTAENNTFAADMRRGGPMPPTRHDSIAEWRKWREKKRQSGHP